MQITSIYLEATWVLALFGSTALLREALGELCVHYIAYVIVHRPFLAGWELDALMSCTNGGRSLGIAGIWRLRKFYKKERKVRLVCFLPAFSWMVGLPIKLIAVTAVKNDNGVQGYISSDMALLVGILWISWSVIVKLVAVWLSFRPSNYRSLFQNRFAKIEALMVAFDPSMAVYGRMKTLGLQISYREGGLKLVPGHL